MHPPRRCLSRFLHVLAGLLLAATLSVAQARNAPAAYAGLHAHDVQRTTRAGIAIETGRLDGVAYRIDVPKDWNQRLVVFYHGYSLDPV
ncbi:MAG TPA: hypothetical protein VNE18_08515, partial [Rhodanobacter sp.]|nr:hypothetical protein [Rhodanobacter sp.]